MKKVILAFSVLVSSHSALAMHAYGNDNCIAKTITGETLEIDLANGQPANPHYIVNRDQKDNAEIQWVEFRGAALGNEEDERGSELVLQSKGDLNVVTKKVSDGCFEGQKSTSTRAATVISVSKKIAEAYGIKKGQTLQFSCYEYFSAPTGNKCN